MTEREAINRLRARSVAAPPAAAEPESPTPQPPPPAPVTPLPPAADIPDEPSTQGRPDAWQVALVVLAVAAAAVLAVTTSLLAHRHATSAHAKSRAAATAAARGPIITAATQEMQAALSYDYRRLDQDFAAAERGLTPSFRASYAHDTSTAVAANAKRYHAVTKATVLAAGVISNTPTTATVLAFVDQTSTNSLLKAPRLDSSRARVTLVKMNGRWLLNSLNTL